ncbi:MAG: hypothetical protein Kow00109_07180 [Acidobacteriota bacterium]
MQRRRFELGLIALFIIGGLAVAGELDFRAGVPAIERRSLLNGMRVWFFEQQTENCPFVLMIENGAAFDPADKWGATYLMAKCLERNLDLKNYRAEFTSRGIRMETQVDWDALYVVGEAPPEHLEFALLTLGEILVRPEFPETSFRELRDAAVQALQEEQENLYRRSDLLLRRRLFGFHPYAHPVQGEPEALENLYLRDLKIQQRRLLLPNQSILAVAYSGDREYLFRRLSRRWGAWVRADAAPFTFRRAEPPAGPAVFPLDGGPADGILVQCGWLVPERRDRQYLAFRVLEEYLTLTLPDLAEEILGTSQVRASVRVEARKMHGVLQLTVEVPPDRAVPFIEAVVETLERVRCGEVDEARLEEAKRLVLLDYWQRLEDPRERLWVVLETDLYDQGSAFLATLPQRLDRITVRWFSAALEDDLAPRSLVAVVAPPDANVLQGLEKLGASPDLN